MVRDSVKTLAPGSVLVSMRARDVPLVVIRAIGNRPIVDCLDTVAVQFICAKATQRRQAESNSGCGNARHRHTGTERADDAHR